MSRIKKGKPRRPRNPEPSERFARYRDMHRTLSERDMREGEHETPTLIINGATDAATASVAMSFPLDPAKPLTAVVLALRDLRARAVLDGLVRPFTVALSAPVTRDAQPALLVVERSQEGFADLLVSQPLEEVLETLRRTSEDEANWNSPVVRALDGLWRVLHDTDERRDALLDGRVRVQLPNGDIYSV